MITTKSIIEELYQDNISVAKSLIEELLKEKIKKKLSEKKNSMRGKFEPAPFIDYDAKNDNENDVHEAKEISMKQKEIHGLLKSHGFQLVGSGRGGHDKFTHPDYPDLGHVAVPRGDASPGVVRSTKKLIASVLQRKSQQPAFA